MNLLNLTKPSPMPQDDGIKSDSLEVTQELLSKYGGLMPVEQHEVLQDALLPMLDEQRGALRKRAINVVGARLALLPWPLLPTQCRRCCGTQCTRRLPSSVRSLLRTE